MDKFDEIQNEFARRIVERDHRLKNAMLETLFDDSPEAVQKFDQEFNRTIDGYLDHHEEMRKQLGLEDDGNSKPEPEPKGPDVTGDHTSSSPELPEGSQEVVPEQETVSVDSHDDGDGQGSGSDQERPESADGDGQELQTGSSGQPDEQPEPSSLW